ncbi:MAG: ATP-binding protein [Candidatus Binatia bacterium]
MGNGSGSKPHSVSGEGTLSHVVISAPSQWGQLACDHLLRRITLDGGKITMIVPRERQDRFEHAPPAIRNWKDSGSVKAHLDKLAKDGWPIEYVYDDHLSYLEAELIPRRKAGDYLIAGYVTSGAEDHLRHATFLSGICNRVLIEKPISRISHDIRAGGPFQELVATHSQDGRLCTLKAAEHYLFRPGVTRTITLAHGNDSTRHLPGFLERHKRCELAYEFHFEEPAQRDAPTERFGAYQDGSILDILTVHGLGPVARLLLPILTEDWKLVDLCRNFSPTLLNTWQGTIQGSQLLAVPVLTETAAELRGTLTLPGDRPIKVWLKSAKGSRRYLRYFRFVCEPNSCQCVQRVKPARAPAYRTEKSDSSDFFFGVSLGADGFTVVDVDEVIHEKAGGYQSDTLEANSQAANAQAAMLDAFLSDEFLDERGRFVPIETACQLVRLGIHLQGAAFSKNRGRYDWGNGPKWMSSPGGVAATERQEPITNWHDYTDSDGTGQSAAPDIHRQIAWALGLGDNGRLLTPSHRILTIVGPEGFGNTTVAKLVTDDLRELKVPALTRIDVPREEQWCAEPESAGRNPFVLDGVLHRLSAAIGIALKTPRRPVEELPKHLRENGERLRQGGVILLNGIDRLPSEEYCALVRIVNELPPAYRLILITNRPDQAAGFVIRTSEFLETYQHTPPVTRLFDRRFDKLLSELNCGDHEQQQLHEAYDRLRAQVGAFARQNRTVIYQTLSYVMYILLPKLIAARAQTEHSDWHTISLERHCELLDEVDEHLATVALPQALVPNSVPILDRISRVCLDHVKPAELQAIRRLARVSGDLPPRVIDDALPGLFERLRTKFIPVRSLFEWVDEGRGALLFARVRRAVLSPDYEVQQAAVRDSVQRRRLMLSFYRERRTRVGEMSSRHEDSPNLDDGYHVTSSSSLRSDDGACQ